MICNMPTGTQQLYYVNLYILMKLPLDRLYHHKLMEVGEV
jgi:hypothetical protein